MKIEDIKNEKKEKRRELHTDNFYMTNLNGVLSLSLQSDRDTMREKLKTKNNDNYLVVSINITKSNIGLYGIQFEDVIPHELPVFLIHVPSNEHLHVIFTENNIDTLKLFYMICNTPIIKYVNDNRTNHKPTEYRVTKKMIKRCLYSEFTNEDKEKLNYNIKSILSNFLCKSRYNFNKTDSKDIVYSDSDTHFIRCKASDIIKGRLLYLLSMGCVYDRVAINFISNGMSYKYCDGRIIMTYSKKFNKKLIIEDVNLIRDINEEFIDNIDQAIKSKENMIIQYNGMPYIFNLSNSFTNQIKKAKVRFEFYYPRESFSNQDDYNDCFLEYLCDGETKKLFQPISVTIGDEIYSIYKDSIELDYNKLKFRCKLHAVKPVKLMNNDISKSKFSSRLFIDETTVNLGEESKPVTANNSIDNIINAAYFSIRKVYDKLYSDSKYNSTRSCITLDMYHNYTDDCNGMYTHVLFDDILNILNVSNMFTKDGISTIFENGCYIFLKDIYPINK